MNRRDFVGVSAAALAGLASRNESTVPDGTDGASRIPLVHITDLYHPPQDPDDHVDLATVVALEEYDLKAVILDPTRKFLIPAPGGFDIARDPGFAPVVQLGYLLGRTIPVATGPDEPLRSVKDDIGDRMAQEQGGVRLLLDILESSQEKVVVSLVGSGRVLAAACNRNPGLVRSKVKEVLLNAGSTGGTKREWNVGLDPHAYAALWQKGLPITWFPCATEKSAFNPDHERGTYWKTSHARIFESLSPAMRSWFTFALSRDASGNIIGRLNDLRKAESWDGILKEERNMWATASLVMGAGRVLAQLPEGWRFVPANPAPPGRIWQWRLDPIVASVNENAEVDWRAAGKSGNVRLFWRERGPEFAAAMSEALGALLGSLCRER